MIDYIIIKKRHTCRKVYDILKELYPNYDISYFSIAKFFSKVKKEFYYKHNGYLLLDHKQGLCYINWRTYTRLFADKLASMYNFHFLIYLRAMMLLLKGLLNYKHSYIRLLTLLMILELMNG